MNGTNETRPDDGTRRTTPARRVDAGAEVGRDGPCARELRRAALVCALLALAWLGRPIARLGDAYFGPTDLTQSFVLTRVAGAPETSNGTQGDVAVQFLPWRIFDRDELRAGRVPLWNPYNGGGAPQLANYQSAVFSPFSLPFYVLNARLASVVCAFLELWLLLFASYAWLRELRLARAAAAAGAVIAAFAGHNLILLQYPHAAVAACVIASLWITSRAMRRFDETCGWDEPVHARDWLCAARPKEMALLVVALAAAATAGHPEVLFFGVVLFVSFVAVRGHELARRSGTSEARAHALRLVVQLLACAVLAAGASAVQWLPFLEYLRESAVIALREARHGSLSLHLWPRLFFPHLFGAPAAASTMPHAPSLLEFAPSTVIYTGGLALFLAACGACLAWRRTLVRFTAVAAVVWFLLVHDVAGVGAMLHRVPLVGLVPLNRSQIVWDVAVALLAAHGVDEIARRVSSRVRTARFSITVLVAGAVVFVAFTAGAVFVARAAAAEAGLGAEEWTFDRAHVLAIALSFGVGLWAAVAVGRTRGAGTRIVLGSVLLAALAAQSAWIFHDYVPLSDARSYYPRTPAIDELDRALDGGTFAILGNELVPPDLNLAYGLRQIASYDALWIRDYDELYRRAFGITDNWRRIRSAGEAELELFGVDLVLAANTSNPFTVPFESARAVRDAPADDDAATADEPRSTEPAAGEPFVAGEILPERDIEQTFRLANDGLERIEFTLFGYERRNTCHVEVALEDADTSAVLATRTIDAAALTFNPRGLRRESVTCAEPIDSAHRSLRLRFRSRDATPGDALGVLARTWPVRRWLDGEARTAWTSAAKSGVDRDRWDALQFPLGPPVLGPRDLRRGDLFLVAELQLQPYCKPDRYRETASIGGLRAFRLQRTPARYRVFEPDASLPTVYVPPSPGVTEIGFDPETQLSIDRGAAFEGGGFRDPTRAGAARRVEVVADRPGYVRLSCEAASGAWLVTAMPFYPGWSATVDGRPVEPARAYGAFLAVPFGGDVPPLHRATHPGPREPGIAHVVELVYAPASFAIGWRSALVSFLLGAVWLVASARKRPPRVEILA